MTDIDPYAAFASPASSMAPAIDPYAAFASPAPSTNLAPPAAQDAVQNPPKNPGMILPMSEDARGNLHFDSNAGVLGMVKGLVGAPAAAVAAAGDYTAARGAQAGLEQGSEAYDQATNAAGAAGATIAGAGASMGPLSPAAGALGGAAGIAMAPGKVAAPSVAELKAAASAGYDQARGMGVDYSSASVQNLAATMRQGLEQDGILASLAPKTHAILDGLSAAPQGSVAPFGGMEAARRALGHAASDFNNPTDQLAASRVQSGLDDFVSAADPSTVVAGNAGDVASAVGDARANYGAAKRAEYLTGVADDADLKAAAANSGDNIGNKLRQRAASIVGSPKASAGFTDDELGSLRSIAQGTIPQNVTRRVGNIFGGGGGLAALEAGQAGALAGFGGGGITGGAIGAVALPTIGYLSRNASNGMTKSALDTLIEQTSKRSPLFAQMQASAPMGAPIDPTSSIFARMMMANGLTQPAQ